MSYFTLQYLLPLFTCAATLLPMTQVAAKPVTSTPVTSEKKAPTEQAIIPEDGALDSNGNPLIIPKQPKSSLHYRSEEAKTAPSKPRKNQTKQLKKSKKGHKQQAKRSYVANDPSCRWLNKRMQQLEKQIKQQSKPNRAFHTKELKVRQKEWNCLKCGAEGPQVNDHARCQYRR